MEAEFIDHFGSFNGKNEKQRWQTLVECIGLERAQEIAAWAERKEIHMMNRGGLMDSLETAAKKWTEKARPPESGGRSGKKTPEEIQARSMENIRKGLEMAFAQDEQHRSQEISPRIPCESWDYLAPCPVPRARTGTNARTGTTPQEPGLLRPVPRARTGTNAGTGTTSQEPGLPRIPTYRRYFQVRTGFEASLVTWIWGFGG